MLYYSDEWTHFNGKEPNYMLYLYCEVETF